MEQSKVDYHTVFNSEAGERVLKDILEYCHMFDSPDITQGVDTLVFREGRRDVATFILQRMEAKGLEPIYK